MLKLKHSDNYSVNSSIIVACDRPSGVTYRLLASSSRNILDSNLASFSVSDVIPVFSDRSSASESILDAAISKSSFRPPKTIESYRFGYLQQYIWDSISMGVIGLLVPDG